MINLGTKNVSQLTNTPSVSMKSPAWSPFPTSAAPSIAPPSVSNLHQNYPNPFNPETWIPYSLTEEGVVNLKIYDINGRMVRGIWVGYKSPGYYKSKNRAIHWDGRNDTGEMVPSGIYFYELITNDFSGIRKMVILK